MSELCEFLTHPALGTVHVSSVRGLPLQERDLPIDYVTLDGDAGEVILRHWWSQVVRWLSRTGADRVEIDVPYGVDVEATLPGLRRVARGTFSAPWDERLARSLLDVQPEATRIWARDGTLLLSQVETWDGVTVHGCPSCGSTAGR